ncbi:MAG TPA: UDP-2,4-diacetamido-2,4,6-trideoxy-beta-L-altropyranose hydrolase [Terriglobales bacterium]|nr:UDP-2,4-diacetamido-2,4,6-trideoxy-beta-L-altropyranose hydrolase [Terriglobales bacterium]
MSAGTLLIRADASIEMGTGHVMRCLALAQAWQDAGGDVIFCQTQSTLLLDHSLRSEGIVVVPLAVRAGTQEDAIQTIEVAHACNAQWLVVDGYHFSTGYQKYLRDHGVKVLFIDDTGVCDRYSADLVVNQNIDASESFYPQCESGQLLLGPQYILLRRQFSSWKNWKRNTGPTVRRVLVTMGGSDPHNLTEMVIGALPPLNLEVIAVVGASNPHLDSLLKARSQLASNIEFRTNVSEMADLMAWADIAVSAGGGTCYELIFFQVPTILITGVDNQATVCRSLGESRIAIDAGWFHVLDIQQLAKSVQELVLDGELRRTLIENCRHLVDGKGAERVVDKMLSACGISAVKLPA